MKRLLWLAYPLVFFISVFALLLSFVEHFYMLGA